MSDLLLLACLVDGPMRVSQLERALDGAGFMFACAADLRGTMLRLAEQGLVEQGGELTTLTAAGRERLKTDQRLAFLLAQRDKLA